MTNKVSDNSKCYSPFFIQKGMKREDTCGEAEKVFVFADKDGDGILSEEEYNRAKFAYGYYPGAECQKYYEETFKDIDSNKDGILSKKEMEEYVNIEIKNRKIREEFENHNKQISNHDKEGSLILGVLGIASLALSLYGKRTIFPSSKVLTELGYEVKSPKLLDRCNKISSVLSKTGLAIGLLCTITGFGDVIMANNSESKRKKLMIEYSDKMYSMVEENPNSEYAKKCYNELENEFTIWTDRSKLNLKRAWNNLF